MVVVEAEVVMMMYKAGGATMTMAPVEEVEQEAGVGVTTKTGKWLWPRW